MKVNINLLMKNIKTAGKKLDVALADNYVIFDDKKFHLFGLNHIITIECPEVNSRSFIFKKNDLISLIEKKAEYYITNILEDKMEITREIKVAISKKESKLVSTTHLVDIEWRKISLTENLKNKKFEVQFMADLIRFLENIKSQETTVSLKATENELFLAVGDDEILLEDIIKCQLMKCENCIIELIPKTVSSASQIIGLKKTNDPKLIEISYNKDMINFKNDTVEFYVMGCK